MPPSANGGKPDIPTDNNPPACNTCPCVDPEMGSTAGFASGTLQIDFTLPGYTSLSESRALNFVYHSGRAYPVNYFDFNRTKTPPMRIAPVNVFVGDLLVWNVYRCSIEFGEQVAQTLLDWLQISMP